MKSLDLNNVNNQIVYIVYGDSITYHLEAKVSILSLLSCTKNRDFTIRILTDIPAEYEGWPVEVIKITQEQIQNWSGTTDYSFRVKTVGILKIMKYAKKTVFLDTDTFFQKDANRLFVSFGESDLLVDQVEKSWGDYRQKAHVNKVANYLESRNISSQLKIINSGVLGLNHADTQVLEQAIDYIDELRPIDMVFRELEQFSCALAFDKKNIIEQDVLYHYFSKKIFFREAINMFFKLSGQQYSPKLVDKIKELPLKIYRSNYFKRVVYRRRLNNYSVCIQKNVLKLFNILNLKSGAYKIAHARAYWLSAMLKFSLYEPIIYEKLNRREWPDELAGLMSVKKQKRLFDFVNANFKEHISS